MFKAVRTICNMNAMRGKRLSKGSRKTIYLLVEVIRFADDFVITARSKHILKNIIIPAVKEFLNTRGLTLSTDKTRIVSLDEGFNFLGYTFKRRANWKVKYAFFKENLSREGTALYPQKDKVIQFIRKIRDIIRNNNNMDAYQLIALLNPILRG